MYYWRNKYEHSANSYTSDYPFFWFLSSSENQVRILLTYLRWPRICLLTTGKLSISGGVSQQLRCRPDETSLQGMMHLSMENDSWVRFWEVIFIVEEFGRKTRRGAYQKRQVCYFIKELPVLYLHRRECFGCFFLFFGTGWISPKKTLFPEQTILSHGVKLRLDVCFIHKIIQSIELWGDI